MDGIIARPSSLPSLARTISLEASCAGSVCLFYGGRYALITTTFSATEYVYIASLYMDLEMCMLLLQKGERAGS